MKYVAFFELFLLNETAVMSLPSPYAQRHRSHSSPLRRA